MDDAALYRFAFIMDQQVGLRTQALNLERVAAEDPEVSSTFVPVRYEADAGPLSRLPFLPKGIRGTLRGVREIRDGLPQMPPPDAALWATWAAKSVPDLVAATRSFVIMDMTPVQMEAMGALYGYTSVRARFLGGLKRRATDRLYRQAEKVFAWSRWTADSLIADYGLPASRVAVVSPGVNVNQFSPSPECRDSTRDGIVRVLFVGGDFIRKGGDLLLRWMQERSSRDAQIELHLVTRDPVPQAEDNRNIVVHHNMKNNSPELVRLYQQCDLFVLPTRADCYSLVAMEAAACGLPVIISAIGGIPDIVEENVTGHLISPDDYETLCSRLDALISDGAKRAVMGAAARQRAVEKFDCQKNGAVILALMKQDDQTIRAVRN